MILGLATVNLFNNYFLHALYVLYGTENKLKDIMVNRKTKERFKEDIDNKVGDHGRVGYEL